MNSTLWPMLLGSIFAKRRFKGDPGDTVLSTRPGERIPHLRVVVTPPYGDPPRAVIVSLLSRRASSDTTVVLGPSDHPSIHEETVVGFENADVVVLERLEQEIENGAAKAQAPFSEHVLKSIQQGIVDSARTPLEVKEACRRVWQERSG